jgi:type 1 glutamine amidotransferase
MDYNIFRKSITFCFLVIYPMVAFTAVVAPNVNSLLKTKRVLVVEATNWNGTSHSDAKKAGLANLNLIKAEVGITNLTVMDDVENMTFNALNNFDIIVFNYVFNSQMAVGKSFETAFKQWLGAGNKGFVAYHTSGANEATEWPWYRDSVTSMTYHKHSDAAQGGRIFMARDAVVKSDPLLAGLDTSFSGDDEWYSFDFPPTKPAAKTWAQCKVLYYMDESSAKLSDPMGVHPMAWSREDFRKNRFFYSSFIHSDAGAKSDFFHGMILRAMEYVAGYNTTPISSHGNSILTVKKLSYITNNRALKVEQSGQYRLSIHSPKGTMLYFVEGNGAKVYTPPTFENPGLYIVKLESNSIKVSQRILVY